VSVRSCHDGCWTPAGSCGLCGCQPGRAPVMSQLTCGCVCVSCLRCTDRPSSMRGCTGYGCCRRRGAHVGLGRAERLPERWLSSTASEPGTRWGSRWRRMMRGSRLARRQLGGYGYCCGAPGCDAAATPKPSDSSRYYGRLPAPPDPGGGGLRATSLGPSAPAGHRLRQRGRPRRRRH
jgi:hypothetical protein